MRRLFWYPLTSSLLRNRISLFHVTLLFFDWGLLLFIPRRFHCENNHPRRVELYLRPILKLLTLVLVWLHKIGRLLFFLRQGGKYTMLLHLWLGHHLILQNLQLGPSHRLWRLDEFRVEVYELWIGRNFIVYFWLASQTDHSSQHFSRWSVDLSRDALSSDLNSVSWVNIIYTVLHTFSARL
jgi:hypothetical protein